MAPPIAPPAPNMIADDVEYVMLPIFCILGSRVATCRKGQWTKGHVVFFGSQGSHASMYSPKLPRAVIVLGAAGLFPQLLCLGLVAFAPEWRWLAISAACFYAATILSFLGGMWWMQGLASNSRDAAPYALGILPPLLGWLALLPWSLGWNWPGPSLIVLGVALVASPLADHALAGRMKLPERWMALRWSLGLGLGILSIITGAFALTVIPWR